MTKTLLFCFALILGSQHLNRANANNNPFESGTERRRLTPAERQNLIEYAINSKTKLTEALRDAREKSLDIAFQFYRQSIVQVILDSYSAKPRSELLLRQALNQALELTLGVPTADGRGVSREGVLKNSANQDLILRILEDSIRMAIRYYMDDYRLAQTGEIFRLPYVRFATDRIPHLLRWHNSVLETDLQYRVLRVGLEQWYQTTIRETSQQNPYAEETLLADRLIQELPENPEGLSQQKLAEKVRTLRRDLKAIYLGVKNKKNNPSSQIQFFINEGQACVKNQQKQLCTGDTVLHQGQRMKITGFSENGESADLYSDLSTRDITQVQFHLLTLYYKNGCLPFGQKQLCTKNTVLYQNRKAKVMGLTEDKAEIEYMNSSENIRTELVPFSSLSKYIQSGCADSLAGYRYCMGEAVNYGSGGRCFSATVVGLVYPISGDLKLDIQFSDSSKANQTISPAYLDSRIFCTF